MEKEFEEQNWLDAMLDKNASERGLPLTERRGNWLKESRQTAPRNQKKYWIQRKAELKNEAQSILDCAQVSGRDLSEGEQHWFSQVESDMEFCNGHIENYDHTQQLQQRDVPTAPRPGPWRSVRSYADLFGSLSGDALGGFTSSEEFLQIFHSGRSDPRLRMAEFRGDTMTEGSPASGGFVVPPALASDWLSAAIEESIVLPRCQLRPMTSETLRIAGLNVGDNTGGSIGGFRAEWKGEADESQVQVGKFREITLRAKELRLYSEASAALAEDGQSFEQQIGVAMSAALSFGLDSAFFTGDGAGQPLGALKSPSLIVIPKEIGQGGETILFENILKLFARLHPSSMKRAIWVANSTTIPQLLTLSMAIGIAGVPVPAVKEAGGKFSLLGMELVFTEKVPVLGQQGDLSLIDFSQYGVGLRKELALDRSNAPGWLRNVMSYRVITRCDGQALWDTAQTPLHGDSRSWAVTLGPRL